MNEKIKPSFKTENSAINELRTKYEAKIKLCVFNLKRSRQKHRPALSFESIGEILAKKKMRRAPMADHEGQVRNGVNPQQGV